MINRKNTGLPAIAGILALLFAGTASAQDPTYAVGVGAGTPGSTVTIDLDWTNTGAAVGNAQFQITYDPLVVTPNVTNCLNGVPAPFDTGLISCTVASPVINIAYSVLGVPPLPNLATSMPIGQIDFMINAGATVPSSTNLTITNYSIRDLSNLLIGSFATPGPEVITSNVINIVAGPTPDIGVVPVTLANFAMPVQNFGAAPTANLAITNTGTAGPLTGSCALNLTTGTDITVSPAGTLNLSLAQAATTNVTFTCDNTNAIGMNIGTYDCTGLNASSGATLAVPVSCEVTAPGPAIFGSTPVAPAGTIDIDAIAGSQPLEMSGQVVTAANSLQNIAAPGNFDVTNLLCSLGGGTPISIQTAPAGSIVAGQSTNIVLACDSTGQAAGANMDTLTCNYDIDGSAAPGDTTSTYTAQCDIRAAQSSVNPGLPDGTLVNINVTGSGGTGSRSVSFTETNGEGLDGTISCSIGGVDAASFSITNPIAFPATVAAGTTVPVTVSGTESGIVPIAATLDCTITDTDGTNLASVSYPLGFTINPLIIPTLSQWGMILMAFGLVGFAGFRMRRRTNV